MLLFFVCLLVVLAKKSPEITDHVIFEVRQGSATLGNITLGLFGKVAPKTVTNFVEISKGSHGYSYEGSKFHRVIANFMIQGETSSAGTAVEDTLSMGRSLMTRIFSWSIG